MSFQKDGKMSNATWAAYTGEIKEVIVNVKNKEIKHFYFDKNLSIYSIAN